MKFIKKLWNNLIFRHLLIMGGMFFSFLVIDVYLRYFSNQYTLFYGWARSAPNLFTFSWIFLFIGILYMLPKKIKMISYTVLVVISNIIVYAEYLHHLILNRFFSFSDIFLAGEGKSYFLYAIGETTPAILCVLGLSILAMIVTQFLIKRTDEVVKTKKYYILLILAMVLCIGGCRFIANYKLGEKQDPTTWKASYYAKNVYIDYNNANKSLELSGTYEFIVRSAYLYIKDILFSNDEELIKEIDNLIGDKEDETSSTNKYTGIFKDKNVIYVLMESVDSWLVNEEVMPTLYKLSQEGLNFTNRYSPTFGGGQTINSEFAMNTSLYAVNNGKAAYNFDSNTFKYSVANMVKNAGYSAVSVHVNEGNFYNRNNFHLALGYEKHYSLTDMTDINHTDYNYWNDSDMIKSDDVYNMIVRDDKFFTYLITYSTHLPYDDTNDRCINNPYGLDVEGNKELSCIRNLARETDEMLRVLIKRLEEDGKLDDTVLVLATDHYTYGYSDKESIYEYKDVDNDYLIQNVPFIIWSNDLKHKEVDTLMDTADILPTVLNMLGISYNPNYYMGTDVFSEEHENFVYFDNSIFYDGEMLYTGYEVSDEESDYVNSIISTIKKKITLNDNIIVSDYFKEEE